MNTKIKNPESIGLTKLTDEEATSISGGYKISTGRVTVIVRGDVSEVQASVSAGIENVGRVNGGQVLSHHIIARPHENLE